ncbi:MAG: exonuclease SbcCD subunit D [Ruminococcus sp.]
MRFLHTSDLHIGRKMNDVSLLDDQKYILERIAKIAEEQRCDAVIIAGDVYDKPTPSPEAMEVFDGFLRRLSEISRYVFVISGNHDSQKRLEYLSEFVRERNIFICGCFNGAPERHDFYDEFGDISVYMLPFIKPQTVREICPDASAATYEQAVKFALSQCEIDPSRRNIIIAHQFVTGAQTCDSEVFAVGGQDNISASLFDEFDYAALGHIHGPQTINNGRIRYSGSPLKYSFSEARHKKSVTIADVGEKGSVKLSSIPLGYVHDVRDIRGSMEEIMNMPYSEDYVRVTVTDEEVAPDARVSVRTAFPNMMKFAVDNSKTSSEIDTSGSDIIAGKSSAELFRGFYSMMNNGTEPSDSQLKLVEEILERLGSEMI